ncbi:hypothetical protein LX16_4523 [Stackebrandtia albiflava]|uniref:Uncharacterized protein n=1 Tax=Stackebrandtia albiflava TaxID=406432 RepID=A0A562URS1_9ACTN|nr:hypothetical protein [Stackebrandtia albiflava]TWJ08298.1 hypothetical protein LX16_4523 [Stackebrandtia albiflava]
MRHIASLLAGIVIAPLAWLLIGAGQIGLNPSTYADYDGAPDRLVAIVMFAAAGILLGLLAVTRLSPAGPVLVGVVFVAGFALFRADVFTITLPEATTGFMLPRESVGVAGESGLIVAVAALLLMSAVVPARWRGRGEPEREDLDTASLAGTTLSPGDTDTPAGGYDRTLEVPADQHGYDDRPVNPFDTSGDYGAGQTQPQPAARSPYADDAYGQEDYDYDGRTATAAPPRYGDQHHDDGGYRR